MPQHGPAGAARPPSGVPAIRGWLNPRRQMVAIGLAGMVLHVALLSTAMTALDEVNAAHADVSKIRSAQEDFQDADMAHDAMHAHLLLVLLPESGVTSGAAISALDRDVDAFRAFLRDVDAAELPGAVTAQLADVRPLQEQYAADVMELSRIGSTDVAAARARLAPVTGEYNELAQRQGAITDAMTREAERLRQTALRAEADVRRGLTSSALAALLAMLGLTALLNRLGGRLARALARERGVAEALQRSLLPDSLPELPGVHFAARYVPGAVGTEVGGDWYDVIPLPSGEVGLVMGDVVGHDLEAAASMGQLRNALRACAADGAAPDDVLQQLNRLCLQQGLGGMATILYAVLDPVVGTLRMASAGHCPPLLVTGQERRFLESEPCPPVGAIREVHYTTAVHQLPPGSLLVLYTDGLVERRDVPLEDGMQRLRSLVPDDAGVAGQEDLCDVLLAGMLAGRSPEDDVALLTVAPQAVLGPHLELFMPAEAEQLTVLRRTLERWLTEAGATDQEVYEITVCCSEAATNSIEHAYGPGRADVEVICDVVDGRVTLVVRDWGQWREARGQDRGRGTYLMHGLMDEIEVSHGASGTQVVMRRQLGAPPERARQHASDTQEVPA